MCFGDPATLYGIGAAATALSTVAGVASGIQQARAAKRIGEYNARLAEQQREIALQRAKFEEQRRRRENRQKLARQLVRFNASGVVTEAGSPIDVLQSESEQAALDAAAARWAGETNASVLTAKAEAERYKGRVARNQAIFNTGTTLLTGLGSTATLAGAAGAYQARQDQMRTGTPDPDPAGPLGLGGP